MDVENNEEIIEDGNEASPEENSGDQGGVQEDSGAEESLRDTIEAALGDDDDADTGDAPTGDTGGADGSAEGSAAAGGEPEGDGKGDKPGDVYEHPYDSEDGKFFKAPASWKPSEREAWTKVPVALQARIKAREAETENILRESAAARRTHDFMNQLGSSYAPVFAAEGVSDVPTGIKGMVDTIALLQNGSPVDKANKMAQLINHYGVDVSALDSALVGEAPENPQAFELQQLIDQKMQPVNQLLQRLNQSQQESIQQSQISAQQEVSNFKGEFLSDVRNDMADLIDMAAARGQQMSLQEAYDKAVVLRPDLQKILTERKTNEEITGQRKNISNKMNAASSISGSRGGIASGSDSLRGAIEDAWDQAG